jgi:hypothetical protein
MTWSWPRSRKVRRFPPPLALRSDLV